MFSALLASASLVAAVYSDFNLSNVANTASSPPASRICRSFRLPCDLSYTALPSKFILAMSLISAISAFLSITSVIVCPVPTAAPITAPGTPPALKPAPILAASLTLAPPTSIALPSPP